jgi:DNA-binding response OmpR family regulator
MVNVLIIEDNTQINNLIAESLSNSISDLCCKQAFSGTEGLFYAREAKNENAFQLFILDLMLPGMNGEQVMEELRRFTNAPIIVVSAKDELDNKVDLLMEGADDYLTKPFEIKELVARVQVQLRKKVAVHENEEAQVTTWKELKLDKSKYIATICDKPLTLTRQEFKILELLLSNPSKVFSKWEIYDYAWEEYYEGEEKTINVHISNIRSKFKAYTQESYIKTVWGIGFMME